ncbi:MAG: hypothetical protein AB7V77_01100 [Candidatus Woesearchaeota archaeon]
MSLETKVSKYDGVLGKLFQEQQIIDVLAKYKPSVYADKVTDLILNTFEKTKDKNTTLDVAKTLDRFIHFNFVDKVIDAISNTVEFIQNKNIILEVNKLLLKYVFFDDFNLFMNAISNTAKEIKDENTLLEVTKICSQYIDNFPSKYYSYETLSFLSAISGASEFIKNKKTTLEVCKTVQQYMGKKCFSNVITQLYLIILNVRDKKTTLEVCKTLQQYVDKPQANKIANEISQLIWSDDDKRTVINRAKTFKKYINNPLLNDLIPLVYDFPELAKLQCDKVCSNLTLKEYKNIYKAQQIVKGIIEDKSKKIKKQAIEGFYTSLNKQISKGKTVQEKLKIINSWANKIYNSILQKPDGFKYVTN